MVALGIIYMALILLIFIGREKESLPTFTLYPQSLDQWIGTVFRTLEFAVVSLGISIFGIREWIGDPADYLTSTFVYMTIVLLAASILCLWYDKRLAGTGLLIAGVCILGSPEFAIVP